MIGYILLISIAVVIGIVVYNLLKTYIPANTPKCSDGISIAIKKTDCSANSLNITLENNGLFSINGYFIKAKTNSYSKISTVDLGDSAYDGLVIFPQTLAPSKESTKTFGYNSEICKIIGTDCNNNGYNIYSIEVIPVVTVTDDNGKISSVVCSDSKIFKELTNCLIK